MKNRYLILLQSGLLLVPVLVNAETHNVSVRDGFFSPNDLQIQPGDTVVWKTWPIWESAIMTLVPPHQSTVLKRMTIHFRRGRQPMVGLINGYLINRVRSSITAKRTVHRD